MEQVTNVKNSLLSVRSAALPVAILLISNAISAYAQASAGSNGERNSDRARSEIVFTDSMGAVLRADPATGGSEVVAQNQKLVQPLGICVGSSGEYFVTDTGCFGVVGVNPQTGQQRLVSCGGILGMPFGIAAERSGTLLVVNALNLVRIDPATGAQSVVASGGLLLYPLAVAVAENSDIYVVNALGAVIRVNARTGAQTLIASGGYLERPQGISVSGNDVYVTDVATPDGNFGVGRIIHVDAHSGAQTVVSEGGSLVGPMGIAITGGGQLIVADPYTVNPDSADLADGGYDGAILRVDVASGEQTVLARGQQDFLNPRGVVVVDTKDEVK
jgi:hypothetical protein